MYLHALTAAQLVVCVLIWHAYQTTPWAERVWRRSVTSVRRKRPAGEGPMEMGEYVS